MRAVERSDVLRRRGPQRQTFSLDKSEDFLFDDGRVWYCGEGPHRLATPEESGRVVQWLLNYCAALEFCTFGRVLDS